MPVPDTCTDAATKAEPDAPTAARTLRRMASQWAIDANEAAERGRAAAAGAAALRLVLPLLAPETPLACRLRSLIDTCDERARDENTRADVLARQTADLRAAHTLATTTDTGEGPR